MKKSRSKRKPAKEFETLKVRAGLKDAVENFLGYPEMKRLNRNIRKTLLLYIANENTGFSLDFQEFMIDLYLLHEFLDAVEDNRALSLS